MFKKIILIISILFFYISIVEACSCRIPEEPTKKEIFDSYDNILIGKLLKIEEKKINIKGKTLNNNKTYDIEKLFYMDIIGNIKGDNIKKTIILKRVSKGHGLEFDCNCSNYYNVLEKGNTGLIYSIYLKGKLNKNFYFPEKYNKGYINIKSLKKELYYYKNHGKLYFKYKIYENKFFNEYNYLFSRNSIKTIVLFLLLITIFRLFKYYKNKILLYLYILSVIILIIGMIYLLFIDNPLLSRYDYGAFQAYGMLFYIPLIIFLLINLYKKENIKLLITYIVVILFYFIWGVIA